MEFKEFKQLINELIDLKIEIEEIKKEEYENLTTRKKMFFNITQTLNKINQMKDVEDNYFSEDSILAIAERKSRIVEIVEYLDQLFGNWRRLFWINVNSLNKKLSDYFEKLDKNLIVHLQVEKNKGKNIITNTVSNQKFLTIVIQNQRDGTEKEFVLKLDELGYDFPEVKNLVMGAVQRQKLKSYEVLMSPGVFINGEGRRLEETYPSIREVYWEAFADTIRILQDRNTDILTTAIDNNKIKIRKMEEEIIRLKNQNADCIGMEIEINSNPALMLDPRDKN